jgi:hypothetical protein
VFEREEPHFRHDNSQTLEPRRVYVYIPIRKQESDAVFDSAIDELSISRCSSRRNRYLGIRSGSATPTTHARRDVALPWIRGPAAERLRVAIGERLFISPISSDVERATA